MTALALRLGRLLTWSDTGLGLYLSDGGEHLENLVKAARRVGIHDARHLEVFLEEDLDRATAGLLLHGGSETYWLTRRVLATPWWRVI